MASQPPRDAIPKLARQPGSAATVTYRIPDPDEPGGRLPVAGTLNFRELGGYRTRDGQSIRRGRVYRSDHLNDVTSDGIAAVASYGLRTVVDLRFGDERAAQPSRLPKGVEIIEARPDGMEAANQAGLIDRILAGEITGYTADDFADDYRSMVHDGADLFVTVLTAVADPSRQPLLFHCTAGKDRTGLVAALLLRLLDVPDETIEYDYWLTNPYRSEARLAQLRPAFASQGIDIEAVRALFEAPAIALRAALEVVDSGGGAERYLVERGLDPEVPAALRASLLEPVSGLA